MDDFPYDEVRDANGDYFHTVSEATKLGFKINQVWSVTMHEDTICYGPSHHYVNLLGYVATQDSHDGKTYFEYDAAPDYP